jgi:hypothetical protein
MRQNILDWNCFLELFQAVTDLGRFWQDGQIDILAEDFARVRT